MGFSLLVLILGQLAGLAERHRAWLDEEVEFLIGHQEKEQFLALDSHDARDSFMETFWKKRDPTPATSRNEARESHLARLREADRLFTLLGSRNGRHTDRGRVYQLLGPPRTRESFSRPDRLHPLELWHYTGLTDPLLPESFYLIFYRREGFGDYRLWSPTIDGPQALIPTHEPGRFVFDEDFAYRLLRDTDPELASAVRRLIPGEAEDLPAFSAESLLINLKSYADLNEERFRLNRVVTSGVRFERLDVSPVAVTLLDPGGTPQVHYALELDSRQLNWLVEGDKQRTGLEWTATISDSGGREVDFLDDSLDLEAPSSADLTGVPISFQGRLILTPGRYRLDFILRNRNGPGMATLSVPVDVPPIDDPGASQILLARSLSQAPATDSVASRPFQIDRLVVSPSPHGVFPPLEITAVIQLWGIEADRPLHWTLSEADRVVWQAKSSVPPHAGAVVTVLQNVPLAHLPDGRYSLEVRFPGGRQTAGLRVDRTLRQIPAVWVVARE